MLLLTHSCANSKTPNMLLLSVIARAGRLFFLARLTNFLILRVLSESEYDDKHLK
jgi:hypothetical protein